MRWMGLALLAGAACAVAAPAEAQQQRRQGPGATAGQRPESNVPQQEERRFPLGAAWIAVSLNGKSYNGSERPSFTLAENFRASGFGGCNTFSSVAYPLKQQGFAVGPLAITKRSCDKDLMAREQAFFVAMRTTQKWEQSAGQLVLRGPNGEIRFERSL